MKYLSNYSIDNNNLVISSNSKNILPKFIPRGLSKLTYKFIEELNESPSSTDVTLYELPTLSKKAIFRASSEMSDLNLGYLSTYYDSRYLTIIRKSETWEYTTDFRLLIYPLDINKYRVEFAKDVAEMAKNKFYLNELKYLSGYDIYAAEFQRIHVNTLE